ncbi:MAG: hypothetical protein PHX21_12885 [bacterium]|nr:hypothetical protein [bacterium]
MKALLPIGIIAVLGYLFWKSKKNAQIPIAPKKVPTYTKYAWQATKSEQKPVPNTKPVTIS